MYKVILTLFSTPAHNSVKDFVSNSEEVLTTHIKAVNLSRAEVLNYHDCKQFFQAMETEYEVCHHKKNVLDFQGTNSDVLD